MELNFLNVKFELYIVVNSYVDISLLFHLICESSLMPFTSSCCCFCHDEWKHGAVDSNNLRLCSREDAALLNLALDTKNKQRKRKICIYCRSRLEVEAKCTKIEVSFIRYVTSEQICHLSFHVSGEICSTLCLKLQFTVVTRNKLLFPLLG